ncbi:MAG: sporulation protein YunB [Firmicutes bacterium]|nr:sporulation protein YunB [Bacillota bacterium]
MAKHGKTYRMERRWPFWLALALLIPLVFFLWAEHSLRPVILTMAEARAREMAVQAMNSAVYEVMREGGAYDDLMTVMLGEKGRVTMMQANSVRMNELATRAALLVQRNLEDIAREGIRIPLGMALGSRMLAGSGPSVRVKVVPMGAVSTEFVSEFTSAGINQTRHRIFLEIHTTVQMVIPMGSKTASVTGNVPVAESIIVGEVPDSFVDVSEKDLTNLLNIRAPAGL